MPSNEFDIYQTDSGYTAVTNPVRRQILQALSEGDMQLAEMMDLTGKAKPTLSSVHLKELLAQRLVDEYPDPADSRRKFYRLIGTRIGSSSVPVDQLRSAVKHYVSLSPMAARLPIGVFVEALLVGGKSHDALVKRQAARLGRSVASLLRASDRRDFLTGVCRFLDQEGLTKTLQIDLQADAAAFARGPGLGREVVPARLAVVLAGLLEGAGDAAGVGIKEVRPQATAGEDRFWLRFRWRDGR